MKGDTMKTQLAQLGLVALCVACTGLPTDKTDDGTDTGASDCDTSDYYDTSACDTGYGVYTGATTLDTKEVSCTSHQFDFEFYTVGLTGGGQLQISGAGWEEDHYVASGDFDPDGWWDQLVLTLPHVDPDTDGDGVGNTYGDDGWKHQENATAGTAGNTLYNCLHFNSSAATLALTFQLTVFDEDNVEADCMVWGDDPSAFSDGCETWN
jgi:hypothetical protein